MFFIPMLFCVVPLRDGTRHASYASLHLRLFAFHLWIIVFYSFSFAVLISMIVLAIRVIMASMASSVETANAAE